MATPTEVARWMLEALERSDGVLYQDVAVDEIERQFGSKHTYVNDNGNAAVSRSVLSEFRALTSKTVVWERGERLWRWRESNDEPGRAAD